MKSMGSSPLMPWLARRLRRAGPGLARARHIPAAAFAGEKLAQQVDDLHRLHELSMRLLEQGSLRVQLRMILDAMIGFHHGSRGLIALRDPAGGPLVLEIASGFGDAGLSALSESRLDERLCARALTQGRRLEIGDVSADAEFAALSPAQWREDSRAMHCMPLAGQNGDPLGAISIHCAQPGLPTERERTLCDICARKAVVFIERQRTLAALAETRGRFEAILEMSAVPFALMAPLRDAHGAITDFRCAYINSAGARLHGKTREELQGQQGQPVQQVLPNLLERERRTVAEYRRVLDEDRSIEFESELECDGSPSVFHCIASPVRGLVAVWYMDIGERKRSEQILRDADHRKDVFLAILAHELRNPPAPIRQAAALSRAPGATEDQKTWSHQVIERQARHMALLLDDLLDISRVSRGMLALRKARAELVAVLEAAIETARPQLEARRHRLDLRLPRTPVHFEADALRISQVVANLLTNAAKYTPPNGRITLAAQVQGGAVLVEVSDNGIGITPQSQQDIFEMFTRLNEPGQDTVGGLGIGLALARGLMELHGGTIEVYSAGRGQGSRFTVRLPLQPLDALAADPAIPVAAAASAAREMLVADDNEDAARSLGALLELRGHRVRLAYDGEAAVASFAGGAVDVCLLDLGMPRLCGTDAARAIRQLPGGSSVLMIAITGWGQEADRQRALAAGFDHHLTKPIDIEQLLALL